MKILIAAAFALSLSACAYQAPPPPPGAVYYYYTAPPAYVEVDSWYYVGGRWVFVRGYHRHHY